MNKGVLWDMDGVLVDTGDFHYQAWVRTLDLYKYSFFARRVQKYFWDEQPCYYSDFYLEKSLLKSYSIK